MKRDSSKELSIEELEPERIYENLKGINEYKKPTGYLPNLKKHMKARNPDIQFKDRSGV